MKHSTPDSMKFRKLQRRLNTSRVVVVGTLELLWIATSKNARRGDIGRFSDEEIAIECDWDGDPSELVDALVDTGFLDRSKEHRLVIHDWQTHAPRYIHAWVKSQKTSFATVNSIEASIVPTVEVTVEFTGEGGIPNQDKPDQDKPNETKHKKETASRSARPTIDEVKAYASERKSIVDPEHFIDHYSANGWRQANGNAIKDWRAAFRTWEKNDFGKRAKVDAAVTKSNSHKPNVVDASSARFRLIKVFCLNEAREWTDDRCLQEFKQRVFQNGKDKSREGVC